MVATSQQRLLLVIEWQRPATKHGPDREGGSRLDDGRDRQDLSEQHLFVAGEIRHGRLDQEVIAPGDQVAGDDRRNGKQRLLDPGGGLA